MVLYGIILMMALSHIVKITASSCLTFTVNPAHVVVGQSVDLYCHIINLPSNNPPYYHKTWNRRYRYRSSFGVSERLYSTPMYRILRDGAVNSDTGSSDYEGRVVKLNDDTIRLYNVTQQDAGRYDCTLDSDVSGCASIRASLTLTVLVPVSNVKLSVTSVKQGGNASFHCDADGTTPITYTWQKVAGSLPGGGRWQVGSGGSVTLSNVQRSDAGSYTCTVYNKANKTVSSDKVYFDVYCKYYHGRRRDEH